MDFPVRRDMVPVQMSPDSAEGASQRGVGTADASAAVSGRADASQEACARAHDFGRH